MELLKLLEKSHSAKRIGHSESTRPLRGLIPGLGKRLTRAIVKLGQTKNKKIRAQERREEVPHGVRGKKEGGIGKQMEGRSLPL